MGGEGPRRGMRFRLCRAALRALQLARPHAVFDPPAPAARSFPSPPTNLQLATLPAHPESVPINRLVAVKGTPLQDAAPPSGLDLVRCVATARVVMPRTVVRLSAGRLDLTEADQALAFLAGANSIFDGDKLLTTANNDRCAGGGGRGRGGRPRGGYSLGSPPATSRRRAAQAPTRPPSPSTLTLTPNPPAPRRDEDARMFSLLGLKSRPAFMPYDAGNDSSRTFDAPAPSASASASSEAGGSCCGGGCGSGQQQRAAAA
jgi:hypothetical protein